MWVGDDGGLGWEYNSVGSKRGLSSGDIFFL